MSILAEELVGRNDHLVLVSLSDLQKRLYKQFLANASESNLLYLTTMLGKIVNHPDMLFNFIERNSRSFTLKFSSAPSSDSAKAANVGSSITQAPSRDTGDIEDEDRSDSSNDPFQFDSTVSNDPAVTNVTSSSNFVTKFHLEKDKVVDWSWAKKIFEEQNYTPGDLSNSHKCIALFEIIKQSVMLGEKLLIFSQFAEMLDTIETLLEKNPLILSNGSKKIHWKLNDTYLRLDGSTAQSNRQKQVDIFNQPNSRPKVFLVSTKAGGLGLSIVGASRLVLMDTSWNPANDQQAIFRIYRYGQQREVHIYRMIGAGTFEDQIFKRARAKTWLSMKIVDEKTPVRSLQRDEIEIFKYVDENVLDKDESPNHPESADDPILLALAREHGKEVKGFARNEMFFTEDVGDKLTAEEKELSAKDYETARTMKKPPTRAEIIAAVNSERKAISIVASSSSATSALSSASSASSSIPLHQQIMLSQHQQQNQLFQEHLQKQQQYQQQKQQQQQQHNYLLLGQPLTQEQQQYILQQRQQQLMSIQQQRQQQQQQQQQKTMPVVFHQFFAPPVIANTQTQNPIASSSSASSSTNRTRLLFSNHQQKLQQENVQKPPPPVTSSAPSSASASLAAAIQRSQHPIQKPQPQPSSQAQSRDILEID